VSTTILKRGAREDVARALRDLWSSGAARSRQGHDVLRQELQGRREDLEPRLVELGARELRFSASMPLALGRAAPADLEAIAREPEIQLVGVYKNATAEELTDPITSPATFLESPQYLPHFTGDGDKVGVVEVGCRVRDTNALFPSSVVHDVAGKACVIDFDCLNACGDGTPRCVSGRCIDEHATEVSSILAQMVPDATIYYANDAGSAASVVCTDQIVDAYDFFADNDVRLVNESFFCFDPVNNDPYGPSDLDGVVQDFHSRESDMLITKAAGNQYSNGVACRDSWNSLCVGAGNSSYALSCYSSWPNPYSPPVVSNAQIDREEPDLVTFGGDQTIPALDHCLDVPRDYVLVADAGSDLLTTGVTGTSVAAPAALGLALSLKECREDNSLNVNSVALRSILREAALTANPDGWAYSTSTPGVDHKDGTGYLSAADLLMWCDQEGDSSFGLDFGSGTLDPDEDGTKGDVPEATPEFGDVPPGEAYFTHAVDQTLSPGASLGSSYRWTDLFDVNLSEGDRVRFSFSFEACAAEADPSDLAHRVVKTDFDVFLHSHTVGSGLFASQSDTDVNEGFDLIVPAGWDGDFQVLLVWPTGTDGCPGGERYAWGAMYGSF